jgi:hypothetical protein
MKVVFEVTADSFLCRVLNDDETVVAELTMVRPERGFKGTEKAAVFEEALDDEELLEAIDDTDIYEIMDLLAC